MSPLLEMPSADGNALRALYRQRLRHGLVVCADASRAEYPIDSGFRPEWGCLAIVAVRNGREEYHFPDHERTIVVDDDVFLVLNASSRYSYRLRTNGTARCLMVCFPPWMVASMPSAMTDDLESSPTAPSLYQDDAQRMLVEQLTAHDDVVTPELRRIEKACVDGIVEPEWHRQQMAVLLTRILQARERQTKKVERLAALRRSTRRELARRVAIATDCIHDGYRHELDLEALAEHAGLSPFHLLRVFKTVHGVTPHEFLQRKRVAVAKRLSETTRLSTTRIATLVGFKSRSSLYRWSRRIESERT